MKMQPDIHSIIIYLSHYITLYIGRYIIQRYYSERLMGSGTTLVMYTW